MPNGLVFKCHLNMGQPNELNTIQMDAILFSYVMVWYSNGRPSTQDIPIDRPFEYQTICNPNFKKLYSNVSVIQLVGIQIPTVSNIISSKVNDT